MVQLATELLSEQIRPVRITALTDEGGEPQGEFVSNQQRFVFKFTRGGEVTYRPKNQQGAAREDAMESRLQRLTATLRAS